MPECIHCETLAVLLWWREEPQNCNYKTFRNNSNNKLLKHARYLGKDTKYYLSLKDASLHRNSRNVKIDDPGVIGSLLKQSMFTSSLTGLQQPFWKICHIKVSVIHSVKWK